MIVIAVLAAQLTLLFAVTTVLLSFSRRYPRWTSVLGPIVLGFAAAVVVTVVSGFDWRIRLRLESAPSVDSNHPVNATASSDLRATGLHGDNTETQDRQGDGNRLYVSLATLVQTLNAAVTAPRPTQSNSAVGCWSLLGVLACLQVVRLFNGTRRVHGLCSSCEHSPSLQQRAIQTLGIRPESAPEIWLGDAVRSPFVVWQRPNRIYLPLGFESFSRSDQHAVLAHEYAHLRRRDPGVRLFVDCVMILLCWHPLAWRIRRQIEEAQEMAADFEAATMLGDLPRYRRALSNWLLWMDQQFWREAHFCVSFSANSAVRRIQMLRQVSGKTVNTQLVIASLALVGSAIFFSGWKLQADDKTKLASAKLSKSSDSKTPLFKGAPSAPWKTVGEAPGYYHVRTGEFTQSPFVQNFVVAGVVGYTKDLSWDMVKELFDKFESAEGSLAPNAKKLEPAKAQELGHEHELQIGSGFFSFRFRETVEWPKYVSVLNAESLLGSADLETWAESMRDQMKHVGNSKTLELGKRPSDADEEPASNSGHVRALWPLVDGGQVTIAVQNPMTAQWLKSSVSEGVEPIEEAGRSVASMIETAAAGVDCGDDIFTQSVRVAAFPREPGAAALEQAISKLRAAYLAEIEADDSEDAATQQFLQSQKRLWSSLRTEIVSTDQGDVVVASFEHTLNLIHTDTRGGVRVSNSNGIGQPLKTLPKAP
ncbi:MAG: M56 family metallopeptidase [Planctomycetota bacterium]